jgi:hypothetical protein
MFVAVTPPTTLGPRLLPALRCAAAAAPLLLLGPGAALSQATPSTSSPSSSGQSIPMRVTTDTAEYCESLAAQVERAEHARRPHAERSEYIEQVRELAAEGHHMCAEGLIRSGLTRLRRAWMILQSEK